MDFPSLSPLEDDWRQNCSKDPSLFSPFSQQRLLVGDLSRPPWLLVASANQLDAGGRKHCLYADPPPPVFLAVLVTPWSRWAPKAPLQWGLQQSSGREAAKALTSVRLSTVSLYPHDALAVSVCHHLIPFTCQLAKMELFNVCVVYFWDS